MRASSPLPSGLEDIFVLCEGRVGTVLELNQCWVWEPFSPWQGRGTVSALIVYMTYFWPIGATETGSLPNVCAGLWPMKTGENLEGAERGCYHTWLLKSYICDSFKIWFR